MPHFPGLIKLHRILDKAGGIEIGYRIELLNQGNRSGLCITTCSLHIARRRTLFEERVKAFCNEFSRHTKHNTFLHRNDQDKPEYPNLIA